MDLNNNSKIQIFVDVSDGTVNISEKIYSLEYELIEEKESKIQLPNKEFEHYFKELQRILNHYK